MLKGLLSKTKEEKNVDVCFGVESVKGKKYIAESFNRYFNESVD